MLASATSIAFPALLLREDDDYYQDVASAEDLFVHRSIPEAHLVGWELVDSTGQRFLIRSMTGVERIEGKTPRWKRLLGLKNKLYRGDLELEALPNEPFEATFHRVLAKESAQEGYHVSEGGGADSPAEIRRFKRCRSIADIIAFHEG